MVEKYLVQVFTLAILVGCAFAAEPLPTTCNAYRALAGDYELTSDIYIDAITSPGCWIFQSTSIAANITNPNGYKIVFTGVNPPDNIPLFTDQGSSQATSLHGLIFEGFRHVLYLNGRIKDCIFRNFYSNAPNRYDLGIIRFHSVVMPSVIGCQFYNYTVGQGTFKIITGTNSITIADNIVSDITALNVMLFDIPYVGITIRGNTFTRITVTGVVKAQSTLFPRIISCTRPQITIEGNKISHVTVLAPVQEFHAIHTYGGDQQNILNNEITNITCMNTSCAAITVASHSNSLKMDGNKINGLYSPTSTIGIYVHGGHNGL